MTGQITNDADQIAAAEKYFDDLIRKLRCVVRDVETGSNAAGRALQAKGMAGFQRAIQQWKDEITELEGELKNVSRKTQHTAQNMKYANNQTEQMFAGRINR